MAGRYGVRRIEVSQPEVCDRCGGEAFRPSTSRERLAGWFKHGRGGGSAWYCRGCGASWSGGSAGAILYRTSGSGWRRWARLPVEIVAALRNARTWHPVPAFYAVVAGVAVVPAVAVAVFTPVRWWLAVVGLPAAAMVAAFVWSLASGARRWRRELLRRVAPQRVLRHDSEAELAAMRGQIHRFCLVVPDGWSGALSLGGAGWTVPPSGPRVLRELTVVADQGDVPAGPHRPAAEGRPRLPRVEIRLTVDPWNFPEELALTELVDRMSRTSWPDLDDADRTDRRELERRLLAAHRERERQRQAQQIELAHHWRDGNVVIDGKQVSVRMLTPDHADVGVATFELEGQGVLVVAEGTALDVLAFTTSVDALALVDEFELRRRRRLAPSGS